MQWKEDTTAGSGVSTGRSAYGIRTTSVRRSNFEKKAEHDVGLIVMMNILVICDVNQSIRRGLE